MASRRGEGVSPGAICEREAGDCALGMDGYRLFIDGEGEGVLRGADALYATRCGGGAGGGGEEPISG